MTALLYGFSSRGINIRLAHAGRLRKIVIFEKYNKTKPEQHTLVDAFDDENIYQVIDIGTAFLITRNEATDAMNAGQKVFKAVVSNFMNEDTNTLVLTSRYRSGHTTFMQR